MKKIFLITTLSIICIFLTALSSFAFDINFNGGYISDERNIIQTQNKYVLNQVLNNLYNDTKTDIAVVTTQLNGKSFEDLEKKLYLKFKIGGQNGDNGVLILYDADTQRVRIVSGKNLNKTVTPPFKRALVFEFWVTKIFWNLLIRKEYRAETPVYGNGLATMTLAIAEAVADANNTRLYVATPGFEFDGETYLQPQKEYLQHSEQFTTIIRRYNLYPTLILLSVIFTFWSARRRKRFGKNNRAPRIISEALNRRTID